MQSNSLFEKYRPSQWTDVVGQDKTVGKLTAIHGGRTLFPQGFAVTERCDKCHDRPGFNSLGKPCKDCKGTGYKPKRGRNGDMSGHDNDGGYALNHNWV